MTRLGTLATALLAVLALGACGGGGTEPNDADVAFASDMIEHHAQAIQMANYSIGRQGIDPRIAELAEEIRVSQTEEIDTLAGYLEDWGEEVPETGFATGDSHSHDHDTTVGGHSGMPGMMSAEDMERLEAAKGDEFSRMWMQMMIEHHEGALTMVDEVQEEGDHTGIRELADGVENVQRTEIKDLERWLAAGSS